MDGGNCSHFYGSIFIPIYLKAQITTIPEFIKRRFGGGSNKYFSFLTILMSIIVDTAGDYMQELLVLQTFFPSLDIFYTCFFLAIITGLYTAGGLKAVVYTDVIQAFVLIFGCSLTTFLLFEQFDYSWENVKASLPEATFL